MWLEHSTLQKHTVQVRVHALSMENVRHTTLARFWKTFCGKISKIARVWPSCEHQLWAGKCRVGWCPLHLQQIPERIVNHLRMGEAPMTTAKGRAPAFTRNFLLRPE